MTISPWKVSSFGGSSIEEIYAAAGHYTQGIQPAQPEPMPEPRPLKSSRPANAFAQFGVLMRRQWRLLVRDKGQL